MGEHIFLRRQDALRQKLSEQNLDGILSSNLTNIRYLCGFTGSAASCLIIPDEAYFISDGRYEIQSKQQVKGLKRFIDFGSHLKIIKDNNLSPNGLKVAFEGDHISANSYKKLSESFPNVHWESTSMILEQMQAVKDDTELEAIRTAVKITDAIYTEILPMLRVGVTEKEIANHLVLRDIGRKAMVRHIIPLLPVDRTVLYLMLSPLIGFFKKVTSSSLMRQPSMQVIMLI